MNRKDALRNIARFVAELEKPEEERDDELCIQCILGVCSYYQGRISAVINPMAEMEVPFIRAILLLTAEKILCVDENARVRGDLIYQMLAESSVTIKIPKNIKQ